MQPSILERRKLRLAAFLLTLGLAAYIYWSALPFAAAQTVPAATNSPAPGINAAPPAAGASTNAADTNVVAAVEKKKLPDDLIQLSFQNASVDMIVQWLSEQTGKSVVKHPRVQCQVTIVGASKVTRREAITLIYRALALEGFTAIESSQSILIVPEGSEPKLSPEMLSSSTNSSPGGRERLVKVFTLHHAQAAKLKDKIKSVLSEKATIESDDGANVLVITDFSDNLAVAAQLLADLDTDKPQDMAVRVIPLKNGNAVDLAKEIAPLYQKLTGRGDKETIEVSANELSNSLMILSSEANFRALQKLVAMLDNQEAQESVTQPFLLKNADAEDVAKQLEQLYKPKDNNNSYPYYFFRNSQDDAKTKRKFSVIADRRRNALIVQAAPNQMDGIGKMIASLDEPIEDGSLAPKIYVLKYVSASDIEDVLNELFLKKSVQRPYFYYFDDSPPETPERDVGRLYGKVRITSEPYSNAIIITSNSSEALAAVEDVLKQLDQPSQSGESTFRVPLKFAKAATMANSINILFAKGGSPALRPATPVNQNPQQPQNAASQQQTSASQSNFEIETEAKEEGYYPWLGGQPDLQRGGSDSKTSRPVSDLIGRVRIVADPRSNSLLISANVHFFPQVMKLIDEMDIPTAQVMIEARIVEVSSDYLDQLGVRWSPDGKSQFTGADLNNSIMVSSSGQYQKGFNGTTTVNNPPANSAATALSALASLRSGVVANNISLDFLIQFLRQHSDATVLAEPQIKIEDNELGKLFVGQQVPFIANSLNTDVGGLSQSFQYKDVGVILEVTPHINDSGDVSLRIRVESSTIVPGQIIAGEAVIDTRNFRTELTAKTGQTLALGGIIQKQSNETLRKTPILGSIPGLKWLFNNKDRSGQRVELLVFLRPTVVRTPQEARELLEETDRKTPMIREWENSQPDRNEYRNQKPPAK